jgi:ATP-dependent DNA helicase RecQ
MLSHPGSLAALLDGLVARFEQREQAETARIQQVVSLVTHAGCQVNALVSYFGEERTKPCGHCTFCLTGVAQQLPPSEPPPPIETLVDRNELGALVAMHPDALGAARQRARFLCGITSPATTRAKLTRGPLFGALATLRFADVLHWTEG